MELSTIFTILAVTVSTTFASTCVTSYHGHCIDLLGGTSSCTAGNHLVLGYCGFLEACCYGASHQTQATSGPSSGSSGSGSSSGSHHPTGSCGVSAVSESHHKIVGGTIATRDEYPWQVSLRYGGQHMCGGTLIDNQWIVTAAHCFKDTNMRYWTEALGVHDRAHIYTNQVHRAAHIIVHEHYDDSSNHNDIALIKLDKPVDTTSTHVRTACLPSSNENFDHAVCTATGWGATHSGGSGTEFLEEVDLPIITNSACSYYLGTHIYDSNICAGLLEGGADACQGDSGGPLVCKKNGRWELAGITSWGYGCGQRYAPGVYTRVASFLDWIQRTQSRY